MSNPREHPNRGGGSITLTTNPRRDDRPQHALDVALAQAALEKSRRTVAKAAMHGKPSAQASSFYRLIRAFCRDLAHQSYSVLSANQRRICEQTIGDEAAKAVRERALATVAGAKSVLDMPLPMKPPPRPPEPDEE